MIQYKTDEEIEIMRESGRKLHAAVGKLLPQVEVGMSTKDIDDLAEKLIIEEGAEPSFKRVKDYSWTTCVPINEQVVHTPPSSKRILKNGDVLTIDVGAYYKGFHSDYATTFAVGTTNDEKVKTFLDVGRQALVNAIAQAKAGNRLGDISQSIEQDIYPAGYHVMEQLTGHGIGRELHEDPFVPGFLAKPVEKTLKIKPGLVIAIEVIYSMGTEEIAHEDGEDWSIITADRSLSACFEHTVAITDKNTFILT
jgi:methionyl aminopeptidase